MRFGEYLRNAREERRVTLEELATRTKIKHRLLADIEEDDLTGWPKYLVYRHGYLRSIADALGLDGDHLRDRFDDAFPEYLPVAFDGGRRWRPSSPRVPASYVVPAAVVVVIVAGLIVGSVPGVVSRPTAPVAAAVTEDNPAIDHHGQDITLDAAVVDGDAAEEREGEVRVVSNPPNAVVTVNGIGRGRTPARIRYLPLGSYTIRVIQFGYRARESRVTLTTDDPVRRVRVALRPASSDGS